MSKGCRSTTHTHTHLESFCLYPTYGFVCTKTEPNRNIYTVGNELRQCLDSMLLSHRERKGPAFHCHRWQLSLDWLNVGAGFLFVFRHARIHCVRMLLLSSYSDPDTIYNILFDLSIWTSSNRRMLRSLVQMTQTNQYWAVASYWDRRRMHSGHGSVGGRPGICKPICAHKIDCKHCNFEAVEHCTYLALAISFSHLLSLIHTDTLPRTTI